MADAVSTRIKAELGVFTSWLTRNGVSGYVGEIGWPNRNSAIDPTGYTLWNAAASDYLAACDTANLWVTYYATIPQYTAQDLTKINIYYPATAGADLSVLGDQALTYEAHPTVPAYKRGVHDEGLNNADPGQGTNVQVEGVDGARFCDNSTYYQTNVPTSAGSFTFIGGRGHKLVRVGFRAERLMQGPGLAFRTTPNEIGDLDTAITRIGAAGMQAILCPIQYGGYYRYDGSTVTVNQGGGIVGGGGGTTVTVTGSTTPFFAGGVVSTSDNQEYVSLTAAGANTLSGTFLNNHANGATLTNLGVKYIYGGATVTQAHFTDMWTRLSNRYQNNANVIAYDLMNEPVNLTQTSWQTISNAAISAIRTAEGVGTHKLVMVEKGGLLGATIMDWTTSVPNWVVDSANNFRYSAHHYWAIGSDPFYNETYATVLANAQRIGYVTAARPSPLVTPVVGAQLTPKGSPLAIPVVGPRVTPKGTSTITPVKPPIISQ
jgi:hypothetical protein